MTNTAYSVLEDIFTNQINVLNIAVRTKAEDVESAKSICQKNNYDVQLVREDRYEDLQVYNKQEDKLRPLHNSDVITGSTPLLEVLEILSEKEYIFVKVKRNITHIVTRADLDSIPVRIWLYGMISLFEQDLKKAIDLSGIQWQKFLEECRLEEAKKRYKLF
jgi:hypothetical protein